MTTIRTLFGRLFPLMAVSGLMLAGWGLVVTPDELGGDAQGALRGTSAGAPTEVAGLWGAKLPTGSNPTELAWKE